MDIFALLELSVLGVCVVAIICLVFILGAILYYGLLEDSPKWLSRTIVALCVFFIGIGSAATYEHVCTIGTVEYCQQITAFLQFLSSWDLFQNIMSKFIDRWDLFQVSFVTVGAICLITLLTRKPLKKLVYID